MSQTNRFDMDKYRTELAGMDDEHLFEEEELEELREVRKADFMSDYEDELDCRDLADLYPEEEWEKIRAAKIEERINEQLQSLEQMGE